MSLSPAIVALATGGVVVLIVAVRLAARRPAPCPSRFSWLVEHDNPVARTNRAAAIVEHLDVQPGMAVLDVGCGPGRVTIPLARRVGPAGSVVAMDVQPGMLERARHKAEAAGLANIRFLRAGAGEGGLECGVFDRALLVTVLGEIHDRQAALREIYGALKPGGVLSVGELACDPHFQARGNVLAMAGAVGFREKARFGNRFAFTLNLEKPGGA